MPPLKKIMNIPFYSNTKDNTHCFQACLKMILKFNFPEKNFSFAELDRVTAHQKGKWTWDIAGMLFMSKIGFDVVNWDIFDYKRFSEQGEKYLKSVWPEDVFVAQKKHSDFRQEQKFAKKYIESKRIKFVKKWATLKEMEKLFSKNFQIITIINPFVIENENGYGSHSVVITNLEKNFITYHDPGLPPVENRKVPSKLFLKAMGYPQKESASLIAVKLRNDGK